MPETTTQVPWQVKFVALAVIWGSSYLLMKVGLEVMDGVQVAALRLICAAAVMVPLLAWSGKRLPKGWAAWKHIWVSGTLLCSLPWTLFAVGEERVTSSITGIANATTPIVAVLCGMVLLRGEKVGWRRLLGVGIGFFGVVLIKPAVVAGARAGPDRSLDGAHCLGELRAGLDLRAPVYDGDRCGRVELADGSDRAGHGPDAGGRAHLVARFR